MSCCFGWTRRSPSKQNDTAKDELPPCPGLGYNWDKEKNEWIKGDRQGFGAHPEKEDKDAEEETEGGYNLGSTEFGDADEEVSQVYVNIAPESTSESTPKTARKPRTLHVEDVDTKPSTPSKTPSKSTETAEKSEVVIIRRKSRNGEMKAVEEAQATKEVKEICEETMKELEGYSSNPVDTKATIQQIKRANSFWGAKIITWDQVEFIETTDEEHAGEVLKAIQKLLPMRSKVPRAEFKDHVSTIFMAFGGPPHPHEEPKV